ncbi:MAG TPA: aldolase/citrate lyase family protein, partial [Burkholderiales bacterium]|nr:aldolase/citrate lyase family protein [Burkholderiales bacterium]
MKFRAKRGRLIPYPPSLITPHWSNMELPKNKFKQALREKKPQIGMWSSLSSHIVAEILAHAGFDWVLLDTEHSPNELP